ncbi:hypothetical protein A2U01_0077533, partial [Trifolium medium]|nr:hypothetical protein [Trifolium medium]
MVKHALRPPAPAQSGRDGSDTVTVADVSAYKQM